MLSIANSIVLRLIQIVITIITIVLAAKYMNLAIIVNMDIIYTVVVSCIYLVYLVVTLIVPVVHLLPFMSFYILEAIMFLFWLFAFLLAVRDFLLCMYRTCDLGRALIAFTLFGTLFGFLTFLLMVIFNMHPVCKKFGCKYALHVAKRDKEKDYALLVTGALFVKIECVPKEDDHHDHKEDDHKEDDHKEDHKDDDHKDEKHDDHEKHEEHEEHEKHDDHDEHEKHDDHEEKHDEHDEHEEHVHKEKKPDISIDNVSVRSKYYVIRIKYKPDK